MYFKLGIYFVGVIIIIVTKSFLWELLGVGFITILIFLGERKRRKKLRKLSFNELRRRGIR